MYKRQTVSSKNKDGTVQAEYTSKANEIELPVAVLVNESSFGAAELFAADIQESQKGMVVGRNTPCLLYTSCPGFSVARGHAVPAAGS